ncbi:MAG: hypothetical protein AAGI52_15085 [Bacteroidota bacterium]
MHLLFHRVTPWHAAIRGSTNTLAGLFADEGHAVTYMEGTAHLGHLLRGGRYRQSWAKGPRREKGAWVFTPLTLFPYAGSGAFATPDAVDRAYSTAIPSISSQVARSGAGPVDAIWAARPGGSALGRLFPDAALVMQVVDYYPAWGGDHIRALEERDYARADLVVSIGHAITHHLTATLGVPEAKVLTLGQGVFAERYRPSLQEPAEIADLPHPRAIWVGWTAKVDSALFEVAAQTLADLGGSLVLIGPETDWSRQFRERHSHVRVLGAKPPEETPAYLVHSDLGLMLYDQSKPEVYKGQHPLKLYEYAAAGLAILTTPHDEFDWLQPPVVTVREATEVDGAVRDAWRDRDAWRETTHAFAEQHDWREKQRQAETAIQALR